MLTGMRRLVATSGVAFGLLTVGMFWPVISGKKTLIATDFLKATPVWGEGGAPIRNPQLSDTIEYYFPSERLYSEHVRRGELPLSNPYVFNGTTIPHGIHIWNSVWPVKLAFLLLFDPVRSYDLFAIAHFWLAGMAFWGFLRGLGMGGFPALAGALAYSLSSRSMVWLHGHYLMPTLAYTPLVFWAARRRSLWGAVPLAGLFFTNPQMALAVAAVVFLWERSSWRSSALAVLLSGVVLVPLAVTITQGQRHPYSEAMWFYRDRWKCWGLLAGLVAPGVGLGSMTPNEWNAYVGLLPLAGALAGARRERFFAMLAAVGLAVATLFPLPVWISPVSFSLPTRYLFFFTLGACVSFARALEGRTIPPWGRALLLAVILVDLLPRFLAYNEPYDPAILRERPKVADLLRGRVGWDLRDHPQLPRAIFPPLSLLGIPSVQGYDCMVPRAQVAALGDSAIVSGDRAILLQDPENPALEALGMRFFITDKPFHPRRFRKIASGAVDVYENPSAPEVPPRTASAVPVAVGAGVTLAGLLLVLARGVLDRSRRKGL
jgi:hypothetical protein